MPFVPVVAFWSQESSISMDELRAAANGTSSKYTGLVVPFGDNEPLASFLGVSAIRPGSVEEIEGAVKDGALGLLRATDVSPRVHALAIDGVSLFGNDRISNVAEWPITINVQATAAWDQAASWTLVAAGDIMLDRGVAYQTTILGKGADYLFDGGTATSRGSAAARCSTTRTRLPRRRAMQARCAR